MSLIAKLTRKEENALAGASKVVGKDLKRICKKYDTKIATFQNYKTLGEEEESIFGHFNVFFFLLRPKIPRGVKGVHRTRPSLAKTTSPYPPCTFLKGFTTSKTKTKTKIDPQKCQLTN